MIDKAPLVSIIIPVFNVEKYLCRCIDSILSQESTDVEILLIDDGSTDKSNEICDRYSQKSNLIKVFHKKNGGVSSARNIGIKEAKGDYAWFVDSDDYIEKNSLATIITSIKAIKADVYEFAFNRNNIKHSIVNGSLLINNNNKIVQFYLDCPKFHLWNKIIRMDLVKSTKFVDDISIGEDFLFLSIIFNNSNSYVYMNSSIYNYFDNRSESAMTSLTKETKNKNFNSIFKYLVIHKSLFKPYNYAALPCVFLNKKRMYPSIKDPISLTLINFIQKLKFSDILMANCGIKQKIYLLIFKIFSFPLK